MTNSSMDLKYPFDSNWIFIGIEKRNIDYLMEIYKKIFMFKFRIYYFFMNYANIKSPNSSICFLIAKLLLDYFESGFCFKRDCEFLIFWRTLTSLLLTVIIADRHTLKVIVCVPFMGALFLRKQ
jgi:hypothetical protein